MQEEQETMLQGKRYLVFGKLGPRTCSLLFLVHTRRTGSDCYAPSLDPLIIYGYLSNGQPALLCTVELLVTWSGQGSEVTPSLRANRSRV